MPDRYGVAEWGAGIGGMAVAGGALGSEILPGWGTVIGTGVGALAGGVMTSEQEKQYLAQQEQQAALERDLGNTDPLNRTLQAFALGHREQTAGAVQAAREAAARGGLTPDAAAQLEMQARAHASEQYSQALPALYESAAQANNQRRAEVLNEYQVAQGLAQEGTDYGALAQQLAGAATLAGRTMKTTQKVPEVQQQPGVVSPWDTPAVAAPVAQPTQLEDWTPTTDRSGTPGYWSESRQMFQPNIIDTSGVDPVAMYLAGVNPQNVTRDGQPGVQNPDNAWSQAVVQPWSVQTPQTSPKSAPASGGYGAPSAGGQGSPTVQPVAAPQGPPAASIAAQPSAQPEPASNAVSSHLLEAAARGDVQALVSWTTPSTTTTPVATSVSRETDHLTTPSTVYLTGPNGEQIPTLVYQPSGQNSGYNEWRAKMLTAGIDEKSLTPETYQVWMETQ